VPPVNPFVSQRSEELEPPSGFVMVVVDVESSQ